MLWMTAVEKRTAVRYVPFLAALLIGFDLSICSFAEGPSSIMRLYDFTDPDSELGIGSVSEPQEVIVREGDLIVGNNETLLIEDSQFNITGKLVITDNASVTIRDSRFISVWNFSEEPEDHREYPFRTKHITLRNRARLEVVKSELVFNATLEKYHGLTGYDQAFINIIESKVTYLNANGDVISVYNSSKLWMKNSELSTQQPENLPLREPEYFKSAVLAFDESEVHIVDSVIDEIHAHNHELSLSDSSVENLVSWSDASDLWLTNSTIKMLTSFRNASILLKDSRVKWLRAEDGQIWLDNCSVEELYPKDKAKIWVVWNLPLLGKISVPYAWSFYVVPSVIIIIAASIAIVVILIARKRKKSKSAKQT